MKKPQTISELKVFLNEGVDFLGGLQEVQEGVQRAYGMGHPLNNLCCKLVFLAKEGLK